MTLEQQLLVTVQLIVATLLSAVVGWNRESREKNAGLRTHILVGTGACLFTALSALAFPEGDPSRIAANIVTGVGFLGAGVIYKSRDEVHELTTAATIWVTAGIGMAVGVSAWLLAVTGTIIAWVTLDLLWRLKNRVDISSDTGS